MSNVKKVPVAEGLSTSTDDRARLIGSRHRATGVVGFPSDPSSDEVEQIELSRTGRLFTWTTQEFVPPSPPYTGDTDAETFTPYAVGYVEFPEGILVEGRLTESDPDRLSIGQEMEVVIVPFRTEAATAEAGAREVVTFAFAPVGSRS